MCISLLPLYAQNAGPISIIFFGMEKLTPEIKAYTRHPEKRSRATASS